MGWIIATILLALLWIGTTWFAGHVIMNMYTKQRAFEDELERRIDMSLQALDGCQMELAMVANKPVFFDSPEVRLVVHAIQRARQAVLEVAEIFKEIEVEDKGDDVKIKDIEFVSSEDPHDPKSTEELDAETKAEQRKAIKKAVQSGKMEVLNPMGQYDSNQQLQQLQRTGVEKAAMSGARAAAALIRQTARINRAAKATTKPDG